MKIFLGWILLAVAFAAPINVEDGSDTADLTDQQTASSTVSVVEQVTTFDDREREIVRENLRGSGIPEQGVDEYFAHGFYHLRSLNSDKYNRLQEWARKWKITAIEQMSYEDIIRHDGLIDEEAIKTEVVPAETTTIDEVDTTTPKQDLFERQFSAEFTTEQPFETYLRPRQHDSMGITDEEREQNFVEALRKQNIPTLAIDDFISQGFHTRSYNFDKYFRMKAWAREWNLYDIAHMSYNDIVSLPHMIDEEENPTESTTVEPEDATTITPETTTVVGKEESIREKLHDMGLPKEAIDEFFAKSFQNLDFEDDNVDKSRFIEWCIKWGTAVEKRMTVADFEKSKDIRKEILGESAHIFSNVFHVVMLMQELSEEGDNITIGEYKALQASINNLSEFEKRLMETVIKKVAKKTAAKYGVELPNASKEE